MRIREMSLLERRREQTAMARHAEVRCDRLRAAPALAILLLAASVVLTAMNPARAATYKWVDDKGVVHYSDKIPPEAVDKASAALRAAGVAFHLVARAYEPGPTITADGPRTAVPLP